MNTYFRNSLAGRLKVQRLLWRPAVRMMLILPLLAFALCSCAQLRAKGPVLNQTSTLNALLDGGYDACTTCKELKRQGNFGIGTFDHLDGEMVFLDGKIYQARADGRVALAPDELGVPFAAVTRFHPAVTRRLEPAGDLEALKKQMDALKTGPNLFLAFRVDGLFDHVKYRSVPAQAKPYPKLTEVAARQPVFERRVIHGTLLGFWCPDYAKSLNLPGYHLHFISDDRQSAGHLLDCSLLEGTVSSEYITEFFLHLPQSGEFQKLSLGGDTARALKAAESGK